MYRDITSDQPADMPDIYNKDVESLRIQTGVRIRECRERVGMTQEELAEALNIHPRNVTAYEAGRYSPSLFTLVLICKTLSVSSDYLLLGASDDPLMQNFTFEVNKLNRLEQNITDTYNKVLELHLAKK